MLLSNHIALNNRKHGWSNHIIIRYFVSLVILRNEEMKGKTLYSRLKHRKETEISDDRSHISTLFKCQSYSFFNINFFLLISVIST